MIVQPALANYRKPLFYGLCNYFKTVNVFADLTVGKGFDTRLDGRCNACHSTTLRWRNWVYFQKGLVRALLFDRPDVVFITADFRALSFWLMLILCRLRRTPCFAHGQGVYNKEQSRALPLYWVLFRIVAALALRYVCYTSSVKEGLLALGLPEAKLSVLDNTIVNAHPVTPEKKTGSQDRLFFVGRLREGSNLPLLLEVMVRFKEEGQPLGLDIVGDGDERATLQAMATDKGLDVIFHGQIYDDARVSEISESCRFGVYPGDAGLSIVHYMSLSLVPVVHRDLAAHMGPEPSYIEDGRNGVLFQRGVATSLAQAIARLLSNPALAEAISAEAFSSYRTLTEVPMAEKLVRIIRGAHG